MPKNSKNPLKLTENESAIVKVSDLLQKAVNLSEEDRKEVESMLDQVSDSSARAVNVCNRIMKSCEGQLMKLEETLAEAEQLEKDDPDAVADPLTHLQLLMAYNTAMYKSLQTMNLAHHQYLSAKYIPKGDITMRDVVAAGAAAGKQLPQPAPTSHTPASSKEDIEVVSEDVIIDE